MGGTDPTKTILRSHHEDSLHCRFSVIEGASGLILLSFGLEFLHSKSSHVENQVHS